LLKAQALRRDQDPFDVGCGCGAVLMLAAIAGGCAFLVDQRSIEQP
jgi:precorrin-6B methylase 2